MGFTILLLIGITWLLWTIHKDLVESNDRQRGLKTSINELNTKLEKLSGSSSVQQATAAEAAATVNINTASKARLQTLPRIGTVGAESIIAARPFAEVEALRQVQGISAGLYEEIRNRVTI